MHKSNPSLFCRFFAALTCSVVLGLPLAANAEEKAATKPIRVALYADSGAAKTGSPKVKESLPKEEGFDLQLVTAEQIRAGALKDFDVLIQPGGSGSKQASTLGEEGRQCVKQFVAKGGGYIGICAGSYLASANYPWSLNLLDARVVDTEHWARGTGNVTINLTRAGRQALGAEQDQCTIYYGQGPLLAPAEKKDINDYEQLASYETEIAKRGAPTGVMKGTTAIARASYEKGRVQCFSPHPEKTPGLEPFLQAAVRWAAGSVYEQVHEN
jgi:glutamine amidotransferase-like uncharacterized protein